MQEYVTLRKYKTRNMRAHEKATPRIRDLNFNPVTSDHTEFTVRGRINARNSITVGYTISFN